MSCRENIKLIILNGLANPTLMITKMLDGVHILDVITALNIKTLVFLMFLVNAGTLSALDVDRNPIDLVIAS